MTDASLPEIDVAELARRHAEGAFVLDVRQPDEYEAGHVPGAVLVPLDQLGDRQSEVPADKPVLVICKSGGRSATAVKALTGAGYDATNVAGGTMAWIDAGHPVAEGPEAG
jgi:rhodanese-related sulfurtransferase